MIHEEQRKKLALHNQPGHDQVLQYSYYCSSQGLVIDIDYTDIKEAWDIHRFAVFSKSPLPLQFEYNSIADEGIIDNSGAADDHYYFVKDHLGSTRQVIDPDQGGRNAVCEAITYHPYGTKEYLYRSGTAARKTFTGKEFDEEGGDDSLGVSGMDLYYFGARYYDADIGLWTAVDPAMEYFSGYTYVGNNPISAIDPNGLWTLKAGFGLGYAVTGKIGYNNGRWTFGFGVGEGVGGVVSYDPSTSISHADKGLAAQLGVSADINIGIGKANIGGNIEATARSDISNNFVNKVKGELSIPLGKSGSITPFYEIGEKRVT